MLVHRLCVVGNFRFLFRRLLGEVHRDALQNRDVQNLVALLPFLDEVHLVVVLVGVELRYQLSQSEMKRDYFLDVVDVERLLLLSHSEMRMDYFLVAARLELLALHLVREALVLQLLQLLQPLPLLVQPFQHRVMPSGQQDRHRVRQRVRQLILDLLLQSSLKQLSSSLLPS